MTPTEIRASRLAAGLTQRQAGELLGHSERTWQNWELGERAMPAAAWLAWRLLCIPAVRRAAQRAGLVPR